MTDYKKLYAYLVGEIDEALTMMDTGDLLLYGQVRDKLQAALLGSGGPGYLGPGRFIIFKIAWKSTKRS